MEDKTTEEMLIEVAKWAFAEGYKAAKENKDE